MTTIAALLTLLLSAPQESDAARLIPADATVLVRVESLTGLVDFANSIAAGMDPDEERLDPGKLLEGMQCPLDPEGLDLGKPLFFSLSIDPSAPVPVMTWIAAVADAAAAARFESEFSGGPLAAVFQGEYVGLSMRPGYAVQSTPSALPAGLRPGLVSAHVDLAALLGAFRPLIDMGLRQARLGIDSMPMGSDMPFDVAPIMEEYFNGIEAVLDSAQSLGLALERAREQVACHFDFLARAGSALDGWESGARADLSGLAGTLDPDAAASMIGAFDWGELHRRFGGFIEAALEVYPEPFSSQMTAVWDAQAGVIDSFLPGVASSFDLGPGGIHGIYAVRSQDAAATLQAIEELAAGFAKPDGFMSRLDPIPQGTQGELGASVWKLDFDWAELIQAASEDLDEGDDEGDDEDLGSLMEKIYGSDLHLAVASRGEIVIFVFGSQAYLRQGLALAGAKALLPAGLARALERTGGGTPSIAYHLDLGRFMSSLGQMMETIGGGFPDLPEVRGGIDYWASIRGALWSGGMAIDLDQFIELMRAMGD